jgi:spermidine/putrescine transport system ATP-binding protein
MRNGLFEQIGCAAEVYNHPRTSFVAQFVGGANILHGTVVSRKELDGGKQRLVFGHPGGMAAADYGLTKDIKPGETIHVAVREEHLLLQAVENDAADKPAGGGSSGGETVPVELRGLSAVITGKSFAGGLLRIRARLRGAESAEGGEISASRYGIDTPLAVGGTVRVSWLPENAIIVDC